MFTYYKYQLLFTIAPILITSILTWGGLQGLPIMQSISSSFNSSAPVNPAASEEARKLLSDLRGLSGKGIISGQHDYLESPDEQNNKLKNTSGEHAVMHGYELGAINNQSKATIAAQRQAVVDSAIKWHREGGIVAMTFHQSLPGTSPKWTNVSTKLSQEKFDAYVTPGTSQYKSLIAELDEIAVYLADLRDTGVPVLWRPYHEMNGDWFWWGKKDNFSALWNIMYDRFVNTHKLNNLLWVWNPNAPNEWSGLYKDYYPGANKVDVLAADIYNNDYKQYYHDSLVKLADGKPIGIGESGELPDPEVLSQTQNKWVYTMTWGKMLTENNNPQQIKSFMNNNYTLSREEYVAAQEATANSTPPSISRNGLTGEYYNNTELSGKAIVTRKDSKIDFNWKSESPAAGIDSNSFSIRWQGKIKPVYSDQYTFSVSSDDGVRVWIGEKLIIDHWKDQSASIRKGSIILTAGKLYDIKIEYYENRGDASIRLMWESPRQKQRVIPNNALFFH